MTKIASDFTLIAAFIGGFSFFVASVFLGGTAFNGKILDGNYFLGQGEEQIQVTEQIFHYSLWHGISFISLLLLAIMVTGINQWLWQRKSDFSPRKVYADTSIYDYIVLTLSIIFTVSIIAMIIFGALF